MGLYNRDYGREQTPWEQSQRGNQFGGGGFGGGGTGGGWSSATMTTKLIIITCVAWLVQIIVGDIGSGGTGRSWIYDIFAMRGETLYKPWLWFQWITYGFLHSSITPMHLFGNMLGLYFFGRAFEQMRGGAELLRLYLVSMAFSGIAGSIFYVSKGISAETIGASGAVACVTIIFALMNRNAIIHLFFVLPLPAWLFAVGFVLYNLYGARNSLIGADTGNTAFMVHLGGIGFAAAYHYRIRDLSFLHFEGLTDLPRTFRDRARRTRLKVHDPDRRMAKNERDADAVLDKVHRQGEESLTPAERKILQRYSRDQRKKRGGR